MAYSDFNLSRVREAFGLVVEEPKSLFLETLILSILLLPFRKSMD